MPILSAELFSALLMVAAVYVAVRLGTIGIALFGVVLIIFQYLVGQLLVSKRRSVELQRMAIIDDLTGLANREYFHARLQAAVKSAEVDGEPFAVMLIDLDRFKEIVCSTINLGRDLGLDVVAEGVEDEPTLAKLTEVSCDLAQGYHVGRPLPADAYLPPVPAPAHNGAHNTLAAYG